MYPIETFYTANMNDQQRGWFHAEYERAHKDEVVGVLFALFLGCFGVHHFYLRRDGLGIVYFLFFWTGITAILGVIECFFMPGRVREYNAAQAMYIANRILYSTSPSSASYPIACASCAGINEPGASFCRHCGAAIGHDVEIAAQPAI
jgi:TM2 domain-containing membrane protein YozV